MALIKQIENDLNQAAKQKDGLALLVLRGLKTALTNAEIAKNRQPLTDEESFKVLKTEIKRRQEAAELYQKGGRPELAQKERQEIEVIKKHLPAELGEDQIRLQVKQAVMATAATGLQDMGKVMAAAMAALKGQADGTRVKKIVTEELGALKNS